MWRASPPNSLARRCAPQARHLCVWKRLSCLVEAFGPDLLILVQQMTVVELLNPSEMGLCELNNRSADQELLLTPMNSEPMVHLSGSTSDIPRLLSAPWSRERTSLRF